MFLFSLESSSSLPVRMGFFPLLPLFRAPDVDAVRSKNGEKNKWSDQVSYVESIRGKLMVNRPFRFSDRFLWWLPVLMKEEVLCFLTGFLFYGNLVALFSRFSKAALSEVPLNLCVCGVSRLLRKITLDLFLHHYRRYVRAALVFSEFLFCL